MELEDRVSAVERDLASIKTDLAVIKSNYATKADVADAKNSVIMWVVSAILLPSSCRHS
jgi:ABC-type metal ion transport system substrate-binding protein